MTKYMFILMMLSLFGFEERNAVRKNFFECVSQADAERILGLPAKETDHSSEENNGVSRFECTFTATENAGPDKISHLYYIYEQYKSPDLAHQAYQGILSSNTGMTGQKQVDTIGDESWLHTDNENFELLIFRKNNHMVRVKINKLTDKTSLPELMNVMSRMAATL
ncbi:hypothetical protein [Chryseolinea soli]|uniref:DUF3558 domain-containing protein n=1 Tax=Chryseolinea soli TaxID=2321403 RepID=A0A385SHR9_9BACT|nr:hypothetical protein [Chryseolinea soli]AYB30001.1 hypothetical protein D4L85_05145 [Chryseolinea soli]